MAAAVLRLLDMPNIEDYLKQIATHGGPPLAHLRRFSTHAIIALPPQKHLQMRRAIAPFFSRDGLAGWRDSIARSIDRTIQRLVTHPKPDLVADFTIPLFLNTVPPLIGLSDNTGAFGFGAIRSLQQLSDPYLSISTLKQLDAAVEVLIGFCPDPATMSAPHEPSSLLAYLHARRDTLPDDLDIRYFVIGLMSGAMSAVQTMARLLHGLLTDPRESWTAAAHADWQEHGLERALSLYPSTRALVRTAPRDMEIAGCPFHGGQSRVMEMDSINATLRAQHPTQPEHLHMSFGSGVHKCPGAALSRLLIGMAVPALARCFPGLTLHLDRCAFYQNPMMREPVALPCDLGGSTRKASSRMVDVLEKDLAREVICDDIRFSPPRMEEHLTVLAERGKRDLSSAIQIARNAMFFMDGDRHAALRRGIATQLGGNRVGMWDGIVADAIRRALDDLPAMATPDLVHGFADRMRSDAAARILGVFPADPKRFEEIAPALQDVLEPWLPMRKLEELQTAFREALSQMTLPETATEPRPLLSWLLSASLEDFSTEDIKAAVLVIYGASFTLSHTLANVLLWILTRPPEEREGIAEAAWTEQRLEQMLSLCPAPKFIYRVARHDLALGEIEVRTGDTLRIPVHVINRSDGGTHLSFGHGLHRCVGAALSRLVIRQAIPALFSRYPKISLVQMKHRYHPMTQTLALDALPCVPCPKMEYDR